MKVTLSSRGAGHIVSFVHPVKSKRVCTSFKDPDPARVQADLERLVNDPVFHADPPVARLAAFNGTAVRIFYKYTAKPLPATWDTDSFEDSLTDHLAQIEGQAADGEPVNWQAVAKAHAQAWRSEQILRQKAEGDASEVSSLRTEIQRLRGLLNVDVKASLMEAVEAFEAHYRSCGVTVKTANDCLYAVTQFMGHCGRTRKLAAVGTLDVDDWLKKVTCGTGDKDDPVRPASPVTKQRRRAYISIFWRWAKKAYGLAQNPMDEADRVKGVKRSQAVVAITDQLELAAFMNLFRERPYWHTWIATACLAGLRYSEQVYLRTEDVDLRTGLIYVRNHEHHVVKTGRERKVPIERTTLLPLLTEHMKTGNQWAFPILDDIHTREHRRDEGKPAEIWASGRNWWHHYGAARDAVRADLGCMDYGPKEWRHTFGTALACCRYNALEIARYMGNSPDVANEFYVADVAPENAWPYKFA